MKRPLAGMIATLSFLGLLPRLSYAVDGHGHAQVTILGCQVAPHKPSLMVSHVGDGGHWAVIPSHARLVSGATTLALDYEPGYYQLRIRIAGCPVPDLLAPFALLPGATRHIVIRSSRGLGLLTSQLWAIAGRLPLPGLRASISSQFNKDAKAVIDGQFFYFDGLSPDLNEIRIEGADGIMFTKCVDQRSAPVGNLVILNIGLADLMKSGKMEAPGNACAHQP